jgi:polysaccharide pyruvyl transferase WcaK-like protein
VPIAVFGISLRSITDRYPRYLLDRIASASSLLGAREQRTLIAFAEIVGAGDPRLALIPDASTQLQPADPDRARQLIERAGADTTTPLVAFCLRDFTAGRRFIAHHYTRPLSPDELRNYIETSGALIEHAVRAHGVGVVLYPMNTNPPDDDRRIMQEVLDGIDDRSVASRVTLIREQHGPRDMKAMLGLMQACVGVRFHSLMLATSMEVPPLSLAYARKNHAAMNHMGLERYSLDLAALERHEAIELFDDLMENHSSIVATLRSNNAQMQVLYDRGLDHLSRAIAT